MNTTIDISKVKSALQRYAKSPSVQHVPVTPREEVTTPSTWSRRQSRDITPVDASRRKTFKSNPDRGAVLFGSNEWFKTV